MPDSLLQAKHFNITSVNEITHKKEIIHNWCSARLSNTPVLSFVAGRSCVCVFTVFVVALLVYYVVQ